MSMPAQSTPAVQPYLFFEGSTEEALKFYEKELGAKIDAMMRFKESPDPNSCGAGAADKIMHASFRIGGSVLFASDGQCSGKPKFEGFGLSLAAATIDDAERMFKSLSEGGKVEMPLAPTFYAKTFGMVVDKYGVFWMVIVPAEMPPQ
jgi:PhnB protein